jgi:hypothetical protein
VTDLWSASKAHEIRDEAERPGTKRECRKYHRAEVCSGALPRRLLIFEEPLQHNPGGEPRPLSGARHERKLFGVGSTAMFGSALPRQVV